MTYSVVARCPETGQLGVAVQTRNLAVGAKVSWIRAGVGAVATQGFTDISYGPKGLELMSSGLAPEEALARLVAQDEKQAIRQVSFVDAYGAVAVHTGTRCVRYAGSVTLEGAVFLANMMRDTGVPEAMAESWQTTAGQPLDQRLMAALEAAQRAGGDIRGKQSAAIKVAATAAGAWWEHIVIDLRVDDHPDPLAELSRLLRLSAGYRDANRADRFEEQGDQIGALQAWERVREALPASPDAPLWHGVFLVNAGKLEEAKNAFSIAYARYWLKPGVAGRKRNYPGYSKSCDITPVFEPAARAAGQACAASGLSDVVDAIVVVTAKALGEHAMVVTSDSDDISRIAESIGIRLRLYKV